MTARPPGDATPFPTKDGDFRLILFLLEVAAEDAKKRGLPKAEAGYLEIRDKIDAHLDVLAAAQETARQLVTAEHAVQKLMDRCTEIEGLNTANQQAHVAALGRERAACAALREQARDAQVEAIREVVDHWFVQGGRSQFGDLGAPSNADELVSAILRQVRASITREPAP